MSKLGLVAGAMMLAFAGAANGAETPAVTFTPDHGQSTTVTTYQKYPGAAETFNGCVKRLTDQANQLADATKSELLRPDPAQVAAACKLTSGPQ